MATDVERLVVQLSADVKQYQNALNKAMGVTNQRTRAIERRFQSMNGNIGAGFTALGRNIAGAFAVAASAGAAVKLIDSARQIENALKVTGLQGEALTDVYDQLFAAAQKNAAPVESLTTLYSKLALTQKELGVSQQELIGFTDKVALALRVGGTDAVAASGALLQLSQALGGGTVRAEEFNSVLEGAPTIMQAAAAGLKEAGGSVAQLRKLVVDGKVSSQAFFRAFEAGSVVLEQKVAGAELTVSQQMVRLQNILVDTAGKIDKATDASGRLGKGIESLADVVRGFGQIIAETADSDLGKLLGWFDNAIDKADQFRKVMGGIPGIVSKLSSINQDLLNGREVGTGLSEKNIQNRIEAAFEGTGAASKTGRLPANPDIKAVSIDDYKVTGTGKGGKGAKERSDEYQREIAQIRERTASLTTAYAAQAAMNPLVNDYGFAVEKARAKQELLTAAQKAGKQITPELSAEIDAAAEAYARAGVEAEKLAEKQDLIRQSAEDVMATAKDVTRGMIDGFIEGEKAADIFANSLKKIGNALIDDVLNSIFQVQNASSGGGLFGSIFGSLFGGGSFNPIGKVGLFASGGYTGPGGKNQPAGIVHKGEVVFSQADVARMGGVAAVEALRRGYADGGPVGVRAPVMPKLASQGGGGGGVTVPINVNIDATGADAAGLARVQQQLAQMQHELPARAVQAIQNAKKRNVQGL